MRLLIVESPNKIKKLRAYVDKDIQLAASVGHIRDLPSSGSLGITFDDGHIAPHYIITKDDIVRKLQQMAKGATEIILASDPDREGEAISWHIMQALGPERSYKRVCFQSITKAAVHKALSEPRELDMNMVNAQQARRVLDRVVGWVVSPVLRRALGKSARSAGRVQSVAVRIVAERELEIRNFNAYDYFTITADLGAENPPPFKAIMHTWCGKLVKQYLRDKDKADSIVERCKAGPWTVDDINSTEQQRQPPAPFTTSTVQQAASVQLRMNPKQCMAGLQKLFEEGLITYHRTDSTALSPEAVTLARNYIGQHFPAEYLPTKPRVFVTKSDNAQEAHEAIRPTEAKPGPIPGAESALYQLIWDRFIACQMSAGRDHVSTCLISTASCEEAVFQAKGRMVLFDGWRKLGEDATSEQESGKGKKKNVKKDTPLPQMTVGQTLHLNELIAKKNKTKAPARYTQASLIKKLEKEGVGRPSTYAAIMSTILQRGYILEQKRKLHASDLGMQVCEWLQNHFKNNFIEIHYTAEMEETLDKICRGEALWENAITEASQGILNLAQQAGLNYDPLSEADIDESDIPPCPICTKAMRRISGRNGPFYSCTDYPRCKGTMNINQGAATGTSSQRQAPEIVPGEQCPKCGAEMRKITGRNGPFLSCITYPKCKGTKNIAAKANSYTPPPPAIQTNAENSSDLPCPECGGPMITASTPNGAILSCEAFPRCHGTRAIEG